MIGDLADYYWLSRGKLRSEILLRFLINNKPLSSIDLKRRLGEIEMSTITFTLRELSGDKKIGHGLIKCVTPNVHKDRYYTITEKGKDGIELLLEERFIESLGNIFEEMGYIVNKQLDKKLLFIPDMILQDNGKSILVEVKKSVNENSISQVLEYMKKFKDIDIAIIVTLDNVDEKIRELADDKNIKIWDSRDLDKLKKILRSWR